MIAVAVECCGCCYGGGVCHNDEGTASMFCAHCSVLLVADSVELVDGEVSEDEAETVLDFAPLTDYAVFRLAESYERQAGATLVSAVLVEDEDPEVSAVLHRKALDYATLSILANASHRMRLGLDPLDPVGEPPL